VHRLLRGAAALVAAILLPAVTAAPADAVVGKKAIWGQLKLSDGASAFPVYKDLGVDVFQYQLAWNSTAPTRPASPTNPADPAYNWPSGIQTAINGASANGMTVALLVRQTPGWANGGLGQNVGPQSAQDYANFLTAARRKYPAVNRWMIWGETNRTDVWASGPVAYADLLDASWVALKADQAADPGDNTVVGGMTFTFGQTAPANWLAQLWRSNGARPRFDEYGHNPFARRCPDLAQGPNFLADGARDISDIDTLREDVKSAFGSYKPLWLSEFAVPSDRANRAFGWFVSRDEQADWLSRAFRIAGYVPGVSGFGWFDLQDENAPNGLTFGLLDTGLLPKPAYAVYKAASMTNTGLPGPCPVAPVPDPPTADPPRPGVVPPAADVRAPSFSLTVARRIKMARLLKGLKFKLTSDESGTAATEVRIDAATARRSRLVRKSRGPVVIASNSNAVPAGTVNLTARVRAAMKRKLKRQRSGTLSLSVIVTDAAGNSSKQSAVIRVRG